MTTPVLQSVTITDNSTIVLHFDRVVARGDGNIVISDGYAQSYYGAGGLKERIVGATDARTLSAGDPQISYGKDVTIHLSSALKNGLTYSVTMNAGAVEESDGGSGNAAISSPRLFNFAATGTAASVATPSAAVGTTIHFTDTGTNSSDYITASQDQVVTGTYSGTLGANEFVQVSLDNGASWHKATVNTSAKTWSYSGQIDLDNLTAGSGGALDGNLLARVSNIAGGSSAQASHTYSYNNHPIEIDVSSNFTFSADTGVSTSDLITKTASQTISGTYAGSLLAGQTVQVSVDGGTSWVNASASAGTWTSNTKLTLLSGTHEVLARVTDAAGNTSGVASSEYTLLTSAVSLAGHALTLTSDFDSGVSHSDGITYSAELIQLNVAGLHGFHAGDVIEIVDTSHSSALVASYEIQASDLYYGQDYFSVDQYDPTARSTINIALGSLSEGAHTLAARIVDIAGNTGTASSTSAVTLDRTAPVISTSAPEEDATGVSTGITKLTFTFNENIAVENGTVVQIRDDQNPDNMQEVTLSSSAASGKTLTINLTSPLTSGTHYTVQGAAISDLAGNYGITGDNPMLHFTTAGTYSGGSVPGALSIGYEDTAPAWDTDSGSALHTDGITSNSRISISGVDSGGAWYYRLGSTDSWHLGSGDGFNLADGNYAMDSIQIKQVVDGVDSSITSLSTALTVDTVASTALVVGQSFTSGASSIDGGISGSTDTSNELVEVSFDHGATWVEATTTYQGAGVSTWQLNGIASQLGDNYALRLSDGAGNITPFPGQSAAGVAYYLADGGVTFSHASDNYTSVIGGDGGDTITLGSHALVIGGDNDTVVVGANAIVGVGDNASVQTGNGSNVVVAGFAASVTTGSGADVISLDGFASAVIHAGAGADTLNLANDTTASLSSLFNFTGIDTLNFASDGTNHLSIYGTASVTAFTDNSRLNITNTGGGATTITLDSTTWQADGTSGGYNIYHNTGSTVTVAVIVGVTVELSPISA
ncbi:Ig-like domain-containing protein [Duganella sp.]|uniref:beta strand repeat-containing protein n=1 Tax=Duganella sp. TaxID=1904440 RepID=UPI0031D6676B